MTHLRLLLLGVLLAFACCVSLARARPQPDLDVTELRPAWTVYAGRGVRAERVLERWRLPAWYPLGMGPDGPIRFGHATDATDGADGDVAMTRWLPPGSRRPAYLVNVHYADVCVIYVVRPWRSNRYRGVVVVMDPTCRAVEYGRSRVTVVEGFGTTRQSGGVVVER